MKQMQLSDYFSITKKTSSIKVNNNLSQTIILKCNKKKLTRQTLKSPLNTQNRVSNLRTKKSIH